MMILIYCVIVWFLLGLSAWIVGTLIDYIFSAHKPNTEILVSTILLGLVSWRTVFIVIKEIYQDAKHMKNKLKETTLAQYIKDGNID